MVGGFKVHLSLPILVGHEFNDGSKHVLITFCTSQLTSSKHVYTEVLCDNIIKTVISDFNVTGMAIIHSFTIAYSTKANYQ